jgi:hypothetical protein
MTAQTVFIDALTTCLGCPCVYCNSTLVGAHNTYVAVNYQDADLPFKSAFSCLFEERIPCTHSKHRPLLSLTTNIAARTLILLLSFATTPTCLRNAP